MRFTELGEAAAAGATAFGRMMTTGSIASAWLIWDNSDSRISFLLIREVRSETNSFNGSRFIGKSSLRVVGINNKNYL